MLFYLVPPKTLQIKTVNVLIGLAIIFASTIEVHLVLKNYRCMVRDATGILLSRGLNLIPDPRRVCIRKALMDFADRTQICHPKRRKCTLAQISSSVYVEPIILKNIPLLTYYCE
jgi:hypothetical protein